MNVHYETIYGNAYVNKKKCEWYVSLIPCDCPDGYKIYKKKEQSNLIKWIETNDKTETNCLLIWKYNYDVENYISKQSKKQSVEVEINIKSENLEYYLKEQLLNKLTLVECSIQTPSIELEYYNNSWQSITGNIPNTIKKYITDMSYGTYKHYKINSNVEYIINELINCHEYINFIGCYKF